MIAEYRDIFALSPEELGEQAWNDITLTLETMHPHDNAHARYLTLNVEL